VCVIPCKIVVSTCSLKQSIRILQHTCTSTHTPTHVALDTFWHILLCITTLPWQQIFALNFPVTALWMKKVEALPFKQQWLIKGSVSAALLSAFSWWCVTILPQAKLDYNRSNAYYGVAIPLLTYIFLRNLSPTLRIHYVEPLHSIGKITLETYLMQHHVWLTSNAKTVLTLVPASPKLNLVITTLLYVLVSKELYRLTMSLRGMLLPDSKPACLKNLAGIGATVSAAVGLATALSTVGAASSAGVVAVTAFVLGLALTLGVHAALQRGEHVSSSITASSSPVVSSSSSSSSAKEPYAGGLVSAKVLAPAVCAFLALTGAAHSKLLRGYAGSSNSFKGEVLGPHDHCLASISHGMWEAVSAMRSLDTL
jgi:10 TM Acyl Transferase domain found in Cas1p